MKQQFDLQKHIEQGVEQIVADTLKATLKNPKESAFMVKFAAASRKASKTRLAYEQQGIHVPGFLIASITSSCNLHCAGCYSRCSNATNDAPPVRQLTDEDWLRKYCSRRVGLTPGTGMTVPILVIARMRSVNRIFFLRSSILNMSEMVFDISTFLI